MNPNIFKAYDIRGIYPKELNEETAYRIGLAFAEFTRSKNIFIGEDARVSSPSLRKSLVKGLRAKSVNVFLGGIMTTPMFYFGVATGSYDAGIMITASHNPGKFNGFKMVRGDLMSIGEGSGMEQIKKLVTTEKIKTRKIGEQKEVEIKNAYIKKITSLIPPSSIKPMKLVIDTGNGMVGTILPNLLKKYPQLKVSKLYFDIDMSFPNHEANPLKTETLKDLQQAVLNNKADLGIAYDGDGDRIGFIDEEGKVIRADYFYAFLLPELFKKYPESAVVYDLRCSNVLVEKIKELGGKPIISRVGHTFIKKHIKDNDAVGAVEVSSHMYFKDFYGVESSDLALLYALKLLSRGNEKISKLIKPLKKYYISPEINFEVNNKEEKIKELKEKYASKAKELNEIDGIKINFEENNNWWWFSIRASNTENLLRLNIEANTEKLLKEKIKELSSLIKS